MPRQLRHLVRAVPAVWVDVLAAAAVSRLAVLFVTYLALAMVAPHELPPADGLASSGSWLRDTAWNWDAAWYATIALALAIERRCWLRQTTFALSLTLLGLFSAIFVTDHRVA